MTPLGKRSPPSPRLTARIAFFLLLAAAAHNAPTTAWGQTTDDKTNETDTQSSHGKPRLKESSSATLIGLNKRSGQAQKLRAAIGSSLRFETLTIRMASCQRLLYPRHEDSAALLSISERREGTLFQGWMYAQHPSLSAMDHPIYDIWVERCLP